jgi:hypothetical protein
MQNLLAKTLPLLLFLHHHRPTALALRRRLPSARSWLDPTVPTAYIRKLVCLGTPLLSLLLSWQLGLIDISFAYEVENMFKLTGFYAL